MKFKYFLVPVFAMIGIAGLQAQSADSSPSPSPGFEHHHHGRHRHAWIWKKLNLSDTQKTQIDYRDRPDAEHHGRDVKTFGERERPLIAVEGIGCEIVNQHSFCVRLITDIRWPFQLCLLPAKAPEMRRPRAWSRGLDRVVPPNPPACGACRS